MYVQFSEMIASVLALFGTHCCCYLSYYQGAMLAFCGVGIMRMSTLVPNEWMGGIHDGYDGIEEVCLL